MKQTQNSISIEENDAVCTKRRSTLYAKIAAIFALLLTLAFLIPLAACGPGGSGEFIDYTVTVQSYGGIKLKDVEVEFWLNGKRVEHESTDADGIAKINYEQGTYEVRLTNLPEGYILEKYTISTDNPDVTLSLRSSVVMKEPPRGHIYSVGDVAYDFTLPDINSGNHQLSELLKEKKAVLLNFWYTTCTWCIKEFPVVAEAYEPYKDDIAVLAINTYPSDSLDKVIQFADLHSDWAFDFIKTDVSFFNLYGGRGYPHSVIIDRYGMIAHIVSGAITEKSTWDFLFETYTSDDYGPDISHEEDMHPNVDMPSSEQIQAAINDESFPFGYYPDENEYSWPWIISEDGTSIKSSNRDKRSSFAIIYSDVTLDGNSVITFDYKVSSEENADYLYVFISLPDGTDNMVIHQFSGIMKDWKTCFAYVPLKAGTYRLALCYLKDGSSSEGDDTAYVRNMRICNINDINETTYIKRQCANDRKADNSGYESYITPVYNQTDGYYHQGTENGPLILANLMSGNTNWSNFSVFEYIADETCTLSNEDKTKFTNHFVNAKNSVVGYAPVDQELFSLLNKLVVYVAEHDNRNPDAREWLEICLYYQHYGPGEEMDNPLRGLSPSLAYTAYDVTHDDGTGTGTPENPYKNFVDIDRITTPHGRVFKYVAKENGAYEVKSYAREKISEDDVPLEDTYVCIYDAKERLITSNDDGDLEGKDVHFKAYAYFEAGKTYYIEAAYNMPTDLDSFYFSIKRVGDRYEYLKESATNVYQAIYDENGEATGELELADAITEKYNEEDGLYHKVNANGSFGSAIYIDFTHTTFYLQSTTISNLLYVYDKEGEIQYETDGVTPLLPTFKDASGKEVGWFDFSQDKDPTGNHYGPNYDFTKKMREYLAQAKAVGKDDPKYGLVAANQELVNILKLFTAREDRKDKDPETGISFDVPNAWLALSYYYEWVDESSILPDETE